MSEDDREHRFIQALAALVEKEDRAALAALRRGLGRPPGTAVEMYPYIVPWLPEGSARHQALYFMVAALFAWHQGNWAGEGEPWRRNLGASFAKLQALVQSDSIERRFTALLGCHADDLPDQLRQAISLLKSREVAVDWLQLLRDLQWWAADDRRIQRQWARAFWAGAAADASQAGHDANEPGAGLAGAGSEV
jgi:CRISPR system Cascade subunit CasB